VILFCKNKEKSYQEIINYNLRFVTLLICLIIFVYQIYQAFATSGSIDMVGYRGEDDGAFFPIIIKIHQYLAHLKIDSIIKGHSIGEHYGYGWFFWIISALFTIPGALISHFFGIDNFFIFSASFLSLILSFAGLFFFYKALSFYTKDELIKLSIIIMILMYPAFGYLSIKWHPTSFNFFFNCLLFYQLAKLESVTTKELKIIAVILAMSIGSRITGVFMLPLVGLFLADRLEWEISKKNFVLAGYFLGILTFFSILFHDPSLFLFKKDYFIQHYQIITNWKNLLGNSFGCPQCSDPIYRVNNGIFLPFIKLPIIIFLFGLFCFVSIGVVRGKINGNKKYDLTYILLVLLIVLIYLVFLIKYEASYSLVPYFYTISFLAPISLIVIDNQNKITKFTIIAAILSGHLFLNYKNLFVSHKDYESFYDCFYKNRGKDCNWISAFNYVKYRYHESYHLSYTDSAENMKKIVGNLNDYPKGLKLLMDFRVPTFYNPAIRNGVIVDTMFDNISIFYDETNKNKYDYIALFKHSRMLAGESGVEDDIRYLIEHVKKSNLPKKDGEEIITQNQEMFLNWVQSARITDNFLKSKKFSDTYYQKVYEDKNFLFFKKKRLDDI